MKNIFYLVTMLFIIFIVFNLLSNLQSYFSVKEGLTSTKESNSPDGIAGNAESYASSLKSAAVSIQDNLLISKYKSTYENIILNTDDLLNNLMLKAILTLNTNNPTDTIDQLAKMQQAKSALNSIMKFVDSQ